MNIGELKEIEAQTELAATPHRLADWQALGEPDGTEVKGQLIFIEEHNTGYAGYLERWQFTANGKRFYIDLLPGLISTRR